MMVFSNEQLKEFVAKHGSPLFVYSKNVLKKQAEKMLSVPAPYGLKIRYAMKANSNSEILKIFRDLGVKVDASSSYEAALALEEGYDGGDILLTSQQLAHNLKELVECGVEFNATSLNQLRAYGELFPDTKVSVRINPGVGSGHSVKTNVGGNTSSFGIWHEYIGEVHQICRQYNLKIKRLHTHIGSGTDPAVWQEVIRVSLELIKNFPDATTINLGGGFKVARMAEETGADIQVIGEALASELSIFAKETGRELSLELEPGTFLVTEAGTLLATVEDIVDTGTDGYTFIKLNTGMNDILRPSLYGAQHPIEALTKTNEKLEYVVVGHNCESGDLLTPAPGDPEVLRPRLLSKVVVGDVVAIGGVGAYCRSMSAKGYNSFPDAKEIVV